MSNSRIKHFTEKPPIIVAIDTEPIVGINRFLTQLKEYVSGVKIGIPYILSMGIDKISEIISIFRDSYFFIGDLKIADIGYVGSLVLEIAKKIGFDGIIAHAMIGFKGGMEKLKQKADELNIFLFALVAMSHPGAEEIINKSFKLSMRVCELAQIKGFVAPATLPNYISDVRKKFGSDVIIISPGIGAQGAPFGSALKAGANYEIIGRKLVLSENPRKTVSDIISSYRKLGVI